MSKHASFTTSISKAAFREASGHRSGVTIPEGEVIRARRSVVRADGLANHDCAGLGFSLMHFVLLARRRAR
jgi:hypothetical protein